MGRDEKIDKEFGAWLKELRLIHHMDYDTLEKHTGIPDYRLIDLEEGSPEPGIKRRECELIAAALKVPLTELIHRAIGDYETKVH